MNSFEEMRDDMLPGAIVDRDSEAANVFVLPRI